MTLLTHEQNGNAILVRPEHDDFVSPGEYSGVLGKPEVREFPNKFSSSATRTVVIFPVDLEVDNETVALPLIVNLNWKKGGKLYKTLLELDFLPERGQSLDLNDLNGIEVTVNIENVEKEGTVYSNITTMKRKQKPAAIVNQRVPLPLKKPQPTRSIAAEAVFRDSGNEQSTLADGNNEE